MKVEGRIFLYIAAERPGEARKKAEEEEE